MKENILHNQINFVSNYKKILEVTVNHEYFKDKKCISFNFRPNVDTLNLFKNYGILFRTTPTGFVLISSGDIRFTSPSFNGPIEAIIQITNTDPFFSNYTDLALENGNEFIFKNDFKDAYLHQNEFADASVLSALSSDQLLTGKIVLNLNQNNEFFGEGSEKSKGVEKFYKINFKSREVTLRYNFYSSKEDFEFSNFYITDAESTSQISETTKRILAVGREVFCIEQPIPIKLAQFTESNYFLKKEDGFLNTFSIQLPHPDIKNVSFNNIYSKYYCEVFVSLD